MTTTSTDKSQTRYGPKLDVTGAPTPQTNSGPTALPDLAKLKGVEFIMAENRPKMANAVEKKYLSLKAAAEWYGVSERTLRRRVAEGALPAVRVGPRSIRVSTDDVAALARPIPCAG